MDSLNIYLDPSLVNTSHLERPPWLSFYDINAWMISSMIFGTKRMITLKVTRKKRFMICERSKGRKLWSNLA